MSKVIDFVLENFQELGVGSFDVKVVRIDMIRVS